ncbi:MAG: hypothetical protein ACLRYF_05110 [Mediterraneibacter faecis]
MNNVINFKFGTLAKYNAIAAKDNDTLYFADGQIFKGDKVYSQKVVKVSALPEAPSQGIIYVLDDFSAKIYTGTDYVDLAVGTVGEIGDGIDDDAKVVTQAAVKAYVAKKVAGMETAEQLQAKIDSAKAEAISSATDTAAKDATSKVDAAKKALQQEIDSKVASVFRFKGAKENLEEVKALKDMAVGDVWHTNDDGKEYVYTGAEWELLGFTVDLSAYATTEAVTKAINDKFAEVTKPLESYYTKVQIDEKVSTINTTISDAKQAAIDAAATDAQEKATKALNDAKAYADGLNGAMDTRVKVTEDALTWSEIA